MKKALAKAGNVWTSFSVFSFCFNFHFVVSVNLKCFFLLIILLTESKDEVLKRDKATKELSESLYIIVVSVRAVFNCVESN